MEASGDGGGDGGSGSGGGGGGTYDKTKVLDVKPLRCLAPIFPSPPLSSQSSSHPFVSAPPFGPFPAGYTPFYPFYNPSQHHHPDTPSEQPLPSFQTPPPPPPACPPSAVFAADSAGPSNTAVPVNSSSGYQGDSVRSISENDGGSNPNREEWTPKTAKSGWTEDRKRTSLEVFSNGERHKSSSQKKTRKSDDVKYLGPPEGDRESVGDLRMKFDALRRKLSQIEDCKGTGSGSGNRRADLRAGKLMMDNCFRTNTRRRIGTVPGVEIGDIFFFRIEMCLVGLHSQSMGGIDFMTLRSDQEEESVAVSIVSSGGYEDEMEHSDVLIYSGQGGTSNKKEGKEGGDQKLERGNLALETSLRRGDDVRVTRGVKDVGSPTGKVYIYDGLYKIQESWMEKAKSGWNVFKYKLLRIPGQPEAFAIWKSIQRWKEITTSRPGLILPDLTSGVEKLPVSIVNDIDDEKGPAHFDYVTGLRYSKPFGSMKCSIGCKCKGGCISGDLNCSCVGKNGGFLPHTANGVIVTRKPLIYECGPSCSCHPNCRNQVSQNGLRVRLEVFKTKEKGWGLRSWDPIRAGAFICEYAGQVVDKNEAEERGSEHEEEEYLFDATHTFNTSFQKEYVPDIVGEELSFNLNTVCMPPLSLAISAKNVGNVARFMNHCCFPNVFWQPVLYDHNDESYPHIMFYAMRHIPPMTELTYDYGLGVHGGRKKCLCGSSKCSGYFG